MMRLIGHLVAVIERHSSQKLSLHPDAFQIKGMGKYARPARRIGGQSNEPEMGRHGCRVADREVYEG